MNKQLITTYFEEFKHWLNGGKLLAKQVLAHDTDGALAVFSDLLNI